MKMKSIDRKRRKALKERSTGCLKSHIGRLFTLLFSLFGYASSIIIFLSLIVIADTALGVELRSSSKLNSVLNSIPFFCDDQFKFTGQKLNLKCCSTHH